MTMAAKEMGRARLTLDLSGRLNAELEQLSRETGRTKADLLRYGVDLLLRAHKAQEEGKTVGSWQEAEVDGRKEKVVEHFYVPR